MRDDHPGWTLNLKLQAIKHDQAVFLVQLSRRYSGSPRTGFRGRGAIIVTDPGEGVMILGQTLTTPHAGIIRSSVRADGPEAAVTIAAMDKGADLYVATNGPANSSPFTNQYKRLSVLYLPPTTGFTPILQVVNSSETRTVTVYVDNFDVYLLAPGCHPQLRLGVLSLRQRETLFVNRDSSAFHICPSRCDRWQVLR